MALRRALAHPRVCDLARAHKKFNRSAPSPRSGGGRSSDHDQLIKLVERRDISTTRTPRVELGLLGDALDVNGPGGDRLQARVNDLLGQALFTGAPDEGNTPSSSKEETRILPDAAGTPLRSWRFGGHRLRPLHDAARRPVGLLVDEGAGERLVGLSVFGDARRDLASANLTLGGDRDDSGTHGQTTAMDDRGAIDYLPHLKTGVSANLVRDFRDQLRKAELDNAGNVSWYATDAAGERLWKVWDKGSVVEERIYLGGYEVWRKRNGSGVLQEERQTLHVMDDQRRVAMIETLTVTGRSAVSTPTPRFRYQLDDQLGSTLLEVDDDGGVNRHEEVHPYGTTAWWAEDAAIEVSRKRYRYTGKERDEETGLQYHSARYYAPWLGRWDRPDPIGLGDGGNRWGYVGGRPIGSIDSSGTFEVLKTTNDDFAPWAMEAIGQPGVQEGNNQLFLGDGTEVLLTQDSSGLQTYYSMYRLDSRSREEFRLQYGRRTGDQLYDVTTAFNEDMRRLVLSGGMSVHTARTHIMETTEQALDQAILYLAGGGTSGGIGRTGLAARRARIFAPASVESRLRARADYLRDYYRSQDPNRVDRNGVSALGKQASGNVAAAELHLSNEFLMSASPSGNLARRGFYSGRYASEPATLMYPPNADGSYDAPLFISKSVKNKNGNTLDRRVDGEYRVLTDLALQLQSKGYSSKTQGTLYLYSEIAICESCQGVIKDFNDLYPRIEVKVIAPIR